MINRVLHDPHSDLEVLVHVYTEVTPPKVHVALRRRHVAGPNVWGPPLPEDTNCDDPAEIVRGDAPLAMMPKDDEVSIIVGPTKLCLVINGVKDATDAGAALVALGTKMAQVNGDG